MTLSQIRPAAGPPGLCRPAERTQYIQSARLNGKPIARTWISHEEIVRGGELAFTMGSQPNRNWGSRPEDAPPSLTAAYAK